MSKAKINHHRVKHLYLANMTVDGYDLDDFAGYCESCRSPFEDEIVVEYGVKVCSERCGMRVGETFHARMREKQRQIVNDFYGIRRKHKRYYMLSFSEGYKV